MQADKAQGMSQSGALGRDTVNERVYRALRDRIISGHLVPGRGVTLRKLAAELDVSPMPVRDAIARLVAERALQIGSNRRVFVPEMTRNRFEELVLAREKLEPEAARRALPFIDRARLDDIRRADEVLEDCLAGGDVEGYIAANRAFHFTLYGACPSDVLVPLIESVWLQFGPFMRMAYGLVGTRTLVDYHAQALEAIAAGDGDALAEAIRDDIRDGMALIGVSVVGEDSMAATSRGAGVG